MRYKRVISFGDSFTWGTDLADCHDFKPSRSTWPALLAKNFGMVYKCCAQPGSSNSSIVRQILSTEILPTDLVIVNWTWVDRWDFYDGSEWSTLRPVGTENNPFYKHYYKYFQSELWDKYETLKNMQLTFSLLDNFISTAIDPLTIDTTYDTPNYVTRLIKEVNPHINWFDGKGFYHWSKDNDFPISDSWHPLELAHQQAFEYIRDNYDFT